MLAQARLLRLGDNVVVVIGPYSALIAATITLKG
jgi:hypothetical protein